MSSRRNLPDDILAEILPRLSQEDLARFKAVCRHWEELIRPLQDREAIRRGEYEHRMNEARDEAYAMWVAEFMLDGETANGTHARLKAERGLDDDYEDEYTHEFREAVEDLGAIRKDDRIGEKTRTEILGRWA